MEAIILDTKFEVIAVIDAFDTFIWTDRYSGYGDFELHVPLTPDNLENLKLDYYITIRDSEHVMIIEDIQVNSDAEDGPILSISGRSLESILDRRIVWTQTVLTGGLQDAILSILKDSIIEPSDSDRKIENFIFTKNESDTITSISLASEIQFTGDNVYDVVAALCEAFDIGFKITLSGKDKFQFELYSGLDRSYEQNTNPYVIFSPRFDNLLSSSYLQSKRNLKTVTLVAGEGEGSDRITVPVLSEVKVESGLDRRELYTDARDVSRTVDEGTLSDDEYQAQLTERGKIKLSECSEIASFEGKCDPNMTFTVGEDYFIGDIVQVESEYGEGSRSRITEIVRSESSSGFEMYPTFTKVDKKGEII